MESLDSRNTGAEGFAFIALAAENSNTNYNAKFLYADVYAYTNKVQWISQIMKSWMLKQNDTHL